MRKSLYKRLFMIFVLSNWQVDNNYSRTCQFGSLLLGFWCFVENAPRRPWRT